MVAPGHSISRECNAGRRRRHCHRARARARRRSPSHHPDRCHSHHPRCRAQGRRRRPCRPPPRRAPCRPSCSLSAHFAAVPRAQPGGSDVTGKPSQPQQRPRATSCILLRKWKQSQAGLLVVVVVRFAAEMATPPGSSTFPLDRTWPLGSCTGTSCTRLLPIIMPMPPMPASLARNGSSARVHAGRQATRKLQQAWVSYPHMQLCSPPAMPPMPASPMAGIAMPPAMPLPMPPPMPAPPPSPPPP